MCEVSNLQTSPNSKKHPYFWGTFGELQLKKALQIPVTPFSAEREALEPTLSRNIIKLQITDNHILSKVQSKSKSF